MKVKSARLVGKENKHLRLTLAHGGKGIVAMGFNMGQQHPNITPNEVVSLACTVDENIWNGKTQLQLKIKDIKPGSLSRTP